MVNYIVQSGITSDLTFAKSGDSCTVMNGGTVSGAYIRGGGVMNVYPGGTITNRIDIGSGGSLNMSGIMNANSFIMANGVMNIAPAMQNPNNLQINLIGGTINMGVATGIIWGQYGGTANIMAGVTYNCTSQIAAGNARIVVLNGARLGACQLSDGNAIVISQGGTLLTAQTLPANTSIDIAGTLNASVTVTNGATAIIRQGATQASGSVNLRGGVVSAYQGMPFTWDGSGSTLYLMSGAQYVAGYGLAAGPNRIVVSAGASLNGASIPSQNTISVVSGGVLSGGTIGSGATVILDQGATIQGTVNLADGASLTAWADAGGAVNLLGSTNQSLVISGLAGGGTLNTEIRGFDGQSPGNSDVIQFAGLTKDDIQSVTFPDPDSVFITFKNGKGIWFAMPGAEATGYSLTTRNGNLAYEVCFLPGCMIRTPEGDRAVETLQEGDMIFAIEPDSGEEIIRPVIWTGKGTAHIRPMLKDDEAGYPVRISKNALAEGVPSADMLVTGEHCLFLEGRFVPVRTLVNGLSIAYDRSFSSYDYHHIELQDHAAIWCNDAATESYLDTGNRALMTGIETDQPSRLHTPQRSPLIGTDPAFVTPLWQEIFARCAAEKAPVTPSPALMTHDPDLTLIIPGGIRLKPASVDERGYRFVLPSGSKSVRLASRRARPCDAIGPYHDDRRTLGVLVGEIRYGIEGDEVSTKAHLTPDLAGWHAAEKDTARWTNGDAQLPLPGSSMTQPLTLTIRLLAAGPYLVDFRGETAQELDCAA
ncbi:Hint domain-containing protein [Asaia krungthepensis]|uniref:Hedgehog/Intein (Hint) domain-containing protein n=1 Tax=Asaia krungthepensis NRIC 0535 TaxID=1307925 RepID=A0ABQ0Q057_9PROT|nr:Hint domain-containing protein [Asaia krungthepensis]GBQ85853.1 hypothetical protein AA0535_0876 [Asaia krungthepensis NRIC 0535]